MMISNMVPTGNQFVSVSRTLAFFRASHATEASGGVEALLEFDRR